MDLKHHLPIPLQKFCCGNEVGKEGVVCKPRTLYHGAWGHCYKTTHCLWKSCLRKVSQTRKGKGRNCCLRLNELKMESACWKSGTQPCLFQMGKAELSHQLLTHKQLSKTTSPSPVLTSSYPLAWKTQEACILPASHQKQPIYNP